MRYALFAVLSILITGCVQTTASGDLSPLTVQVLSPAPWSSHDSTFTCRFLVRNPGFRTVVGQTSGGPSQTARCYYPWGGFVAEYPAARFLMIVPLRFEPLAAEVYEVTIPVRGGPSQSGLGPGTYRIELGFLDHSQPCEDLWVTVR